LLLTASVVAIVCTIAVAALWYLEASANPPPQPGLPPDGPPPGAGRKHATLVVVVGICTVAWTSVVVIAARDQVLRHLDLVSRRLTDAGREFILAGEQLGVFRGMKIEEKGRRPGNDHPAGSRPTDPDSTGGPGHPMGFSPGGGSGGGPSGGGGHVLPFPLTPRDED
jgi:hypothetical protein